MHVFVSIQMSADISLSEFISSQISVPASKIHQRPENTETIQSKALNQEALIWKVM